MGREGVTFHQVAAAAEDLVAEGQRPSTRAIRARTGGSPNTIHRHLRVWLEQNPSTSPAPAIEMPAVMLRVYREEVSRLVSLARAGLEARLVEAQAEASDLGQAGDALEKERDALAEQLVAVTSERDAWAGKVELHEAEIENLKLELERERRAAEEGRIAVAQERLTTDQLREQVGTLRAELRVARDDYKREHDLRIQAQRDAVLADVARASLVERLTEVRERERQAESEVNTLRARLEELVTEAGERGADNQHLIHELTSARESERRAIAALEAARAEVDRARKEAEQQLVHHRHELHQRALEHARLCGQIDALRRSEEAGDEEADDEQVADEEPPPNT